ncbi:hypothetical protein COO91_00879 [Nostoc flagelliforme CCNUN1]|uniref:Uncharacterized protein n=1 Tax=Nostoc flagelliforme CCNUN1 TaxID=2038116 RepID=A0A2K8SHY1_9NOSO|nr:hypothetical protein [Nostoc flagelliforme]AUB35028.1 hypothetical protein COO91_00879 [Nostoc flagelliforme CCNUN1]
MKALQAKAPQYLGLAENIIETAGHFIIWIFLCGVAFQLKSLGIPYHQPSVRGIAARFQSH